jgi:hypothetical protein
MLRQALLMYARAVPAPADFAFPLYGEDRERGDLRD